VPDPAAVALEFVRSINAHDLDGLCALMTEDHVFTDYGGATQGGRAAMRAGWEGYFRAWPNYRVRIEQVLASGNSVALVGTVSGSHLAARETGRTFAWTAEVRDGLVASWRVYSGPVPRTDD
jgi:uncharacterized protein (TIGR02246 family)